MIAISQYKVQSILSVFVLCFGTSAYGSDITLQWNANVEPDLLGYKVYYHPGPSAPPYTGGTANEGDSPIQVSTDDVTLEDVCKFTLSGLPDSEAYYFVVTALDTQGNESGYSGEACFKCTEPGITGYSDAVDSGGGGGCLIGAAADSPR